jgi:choline dehydrogenase-like flavoprotein
MTTTRRFFGRRLLEAAAALGLESLGPQLLRYLSSASALGAAACASRANDELDGLSAPLVHLHSDVVIVGSGYGGAVTAKRLTEKGVSVLMLEMGRLWNAVSDKVELQWAAEQNAPAVKSARHVFDKLNRAAGSTYNTLMFRGKEFQDQMTYHPVGGCPLGEATDAYGRVLGYDGLYIADGSLIPRGLLANPALTIAALAERNIERIAAEDLRL